MSLSHQLVIRLHVLAAGNVLVPQPRPVVEVGVVRPAPGVLLLGRLGRHVLGIRHALTSHAMSWAARDNYTSPHCYQLLTCRYISEDLFSLQRTA